MTTLFDPLKVGNIEIANRIVMAPMTRSRANDEGVQPIYAANYYAQRASAGLIITEATNVSPMAKGYVRTPGIYTAAQIESWKPVTAAVHAKGGKIFMQLFHTGRIALPDFLPDSAQPVAAQAFPQYVPGAVAFGQVVVDGDQMRAFPFERVEINRKCRNQRFPFAGFHFGDAALVQDHSADQLDVEVTHIELAPRHFPADGKSLGQDVVERLAGRQPLLELLGLVG